MFKKYFIYTVASIAILSTSINHAESRYFLCGPDEDRCFLDDPNYYKYCACIPYNEVHGAQPYCMRGLTCEPLSSVPSCESFNIYPDQGSCIATLYHSIPTPGCDTVPKSFCVDNHILMCNVNGDIYSCQRSIQHN